MRLKQEDSITGDKCHYNLVGLSDKQLKQLLKSTPIDAFQYCNYGITHSLTSEVLERLAKAEGA